MGISKSKSLKNARQSMYGKWHNGITNKNGDFPQKDKGSEKKNNGCAIKISNPSWDHGELTLTNANLMRTQWPTWCAPNSGCPKSAKSETPCFGKPQTFAQPSTAAMWPIFETKKWSVGWVWNACVPLNNHNFPTWSYIFLLLSYIIIHGHILSYIFPIHMAILRVNPPLSGPQPPGGSKYSKLQRSRAWIK